MKPALASAVDTRYAVVVHDLGYTDPKMVSKDSYAPGSAQSRVFIVDLGSGTVLHGFDVRATTPSEIKFTYDANSQSGTEDVRRHAAAGAANCAW